jgi:hypothetical protein
VVHPMNEDQRHTVTYRSTENICEMRLTARILFLTTFCLVAVDGPNALGWFLCALLELLLRAYIKHRSQHIRNYEATNYQSRAHSLVSPTNDRLQLNASIKFGGQYGCGMLLNCRMLNMFASDRTGLPRSCYYIWTSR